jgi:hypothetical protein
MKKLTLFLFIIGGLMSTQAQESISNDSINEKHRTLIFKLGLNLVDSTGGNDPFTVFSDFDQMVFSENYNFELEYRFSKWFSLAFAMSNNKWKANKGKIDGIIVSTDQKYLALDLDLKYYFDEAFDWFDQNDWVELYLHGGVGSALQANKSGVSLNFGPGANFWISEQFGVNVNGTGKWMLNNGDNLYASNHFQYSASLMYRFINNDDDNDGVKNSNDNCPNVAGVASNNGCPEYAVTAFKFNAIDFLLKPIDPKDLMRTVKTLEENLKNKLFTTNPQLKSTKTSIETKTSDYNFIAIPSTKKIDFIKLDNILYFESDGRYTTIHLIDKTTFFVSKNIGEYDKILAPRHFFRIHKKYLINIKYIVNINNADGSNCELVGRLILPVAKRRKEDLVSFLNIR